MSEFRPGDTLKLKSQNAVIRIFCNLFGVQECELTDLKKALKYMEGKIFTLTKITKFKIEKTQKTANICFFEENWNVVKPDSDNVRKWWTLTSEMFDLYQQENESLSPMFGVMEYQDGI